MADETVHLVEGKDNKPPEQPELSICQYVNPPTGFSEAVLALYKNDLDCVQNNVKEIIRNQVVLRDMAQNELTQLKENAMLVDMMKTFDDVKVYHKKLVNMKKNMISLSNRMDKVKVRAQKLQGQKEKENLQVAQEKERQQKYEKDLTARPAAQYSEDKPQNS